MSARSRRATSRRRRLWAAASASRSAAASARSPRCIDRYPLGREATISWGGPELIFRNDWPAAVLIKLDTTDTSITVRFYSSPLGRRVESETSAPYGPGGGGFTVEYTRRVYEGERLRRNERYVVHYGTAPAHGR